METTETTQLLGPKAALEQQQQNSLDRAKQLELRVESLQTLNQKLHRYLQIVGDALLEQAIEREWCEEYNEFVTELNRKAGSDILQLMTKSYSRTLHINLEVQGTDDEEAVWDGIEEAITEHCFSEGIEVSL